MNRTWVYTTMTGESSLMTAVPGGVHSSTALDKTPTLKPFIMYRSLSHYPEFRGDDRNLVKNENFLIFVHDVPGDYLQIETILDQLKDLFDGVTDPDNGIVCSTWLEDSEDFRDDDMGTILKYARISVKYRT